MAEDEVNIRFGALVNGVTEAVEGIKESLGSLLAPVHALGASFSELTEFMLGAFAVEKIEHWADEISEIGERAENLSHQLGLPVEQITRMGFEAQLSGLSAEGMAHGMDRLAMSMSAAARGSAQQQAAFAALGLSATDSEGHLKSLDEMMGEIADKFAETADGPEKTAIAIALFGRAGAEMIPMLDRGSAGLKAMGDAAAATGTVLTGQAAEALEQTHANLVTMDAAFEGAAITLFQAFEPAIDAIVQGITEMVESFTAGVKGTGLLHDAIVVLSGAFKLAVIAVTDFSTGLQNMYQIAAMVFEGLMSGLGALGRSVYDAFTGQWGKIAGEWSAAGDQLVDIVRERMQKIIDQTAEAQKVFDKLNPFSGAEESAENPEEEKPKLSTIGSEEGGDSKSRLQQWRDQLDQQLMDERNFFNDSKAEELAFWQAKLGLTQAGSQEQLEVRRTIFTLERDMARQARSDAQAMEKDQADTALSIGKTKLQAERDDLDAEVDAHKITATQKVQILRQLADEEFALDLQRLQDELNTLEARTPEYQRVYDQIEKLKVEHEAKMADLTRQGAAAQKQELDKGTQEWEQRLRPIDSAFSQSINGMIQGTQTFGQAMARMGQSIVMSFVAAAEQLLTHWIATELAKTTITQTNVAVRNAETATEGDSLFGVIGKMIAGWLGLETTKTASSTAGVATTIASNAMEAASNAALAATAAMASVAAIPLIGWQMAPEVGMATYAEAMGFAGLTSAAGGAWQLPADMLLLAHQNESVLPASIAGPMRSFFTQGAGSGAGGGGSSGLPALNLTVQAIDGQSVVQHANRFAQIYAQAVAEYMNRNPSVRPAY